VTYRTRFAPSPTGPLHLGHAYSALTAFDRAQAQGGTFLLRIEDIDQTRARAEWETAIYDDLAWLGLTWPTPVMRQSEQMARYRAALEDLWQRGLLFHCTCTRRDILEAASAPQEGARHGPDGIVYPGTCRARTIPRPGAPLPDGALRLNLSDALASLSKPLEFLENGEGPGGETGRQEALPDDLLQNVGDVVLARREMGTSYHLAIVLDDAAQGVSEVVRGQDLFSSTVIHVLLQQLLGLPTPAYHHHSLVRDEAGKRLAKRDDARALLLFRADGATPQDIRARIGL